MTRMGRRVRRWGTGSLTPGGNGMTGLQGDHCREPGQTACPPSARNPRLNKKSPARIAGLFSFTGATYFFFFVAFFFAGAFFAGIAFIHLLSSLRLLLTSSG